MTPIRALRMIVIISPQGIEVVRPLPDELGNDIHKKRRKNPRKNHLLELVMERLFGMLLQG
jgi:hypothetical protein